MIKSTTEDDEIEEVDNEEQKNRQSDTKEFALPVLSDDELNELRKMYDGLVDGSVTSESRTEITITCQGSEICL